MMLKKVRVVVSIVLFSLLTFYFLDFADLLPASFHKLASLQFIPALIAVNILALFIVLLLTFLFGRIYCSSVCPLGIFQDFISWSAKKFQRKRKFSFLKERKLLRWSVVAITLIAFVSGASFFVGLLDPYSAYGRMATTFFKPVYLAFNNFIAWIDNYYKHYRFYKVDIIVSGIATLFIAFLTMVTVAFLSYKWGRLYCNTICPVGTVLGFISRFSIFKVRINEITCNSCGLCAMNCKSSCIDKSTKTIDYSRCVECFNCIESCHKNALQYGFALSKSSTNNKTIVNDKRAPSRRKFFAFILAGIAGGKKLFGRDSSDTITIKEIYTSHNVPYKRKNPVTPPGSVDVKRFNGHCTSCHLCVSKCPSNVLKPAFLEYGLEGVLQPTMNFEHGYCNYHCTVCADICPAEALEKITDKEKKTLQVGYVHYIKENCVVVTDGTDCGACSEHCPTQAVSMQPYKGDLRIPVIDQNLCVGCGGCEYICPTRPYRAIYVVGNPVHKQALIPEEKEQKKIEVDGFGF